MKFELTKEQIEKAKVFMEAQNAIVQKQQHIEGTKEQNEMFPEAYYGTIGGGYSYTFVVTSIGVGASIQNNITEASLDLTDYDLW